MLLQILLRPTSSETCISHLLEFGAYAKYPLVEMLHKVKIPMCFLFGQVDWIRRMPVDELIAYDMLNKESYVCIIDKAGHHMYIENPLHIVGCMVGFIEGQDKKEEFLIENNYEEWLETFVCTKETTNPY